MNDLVENARQNITKLEAELTVIKADINSQIVPYSDIRNQTYIMGQLLEEISDDLEEAEKIEDASEYGSDIPEIPESRGDGK